MTRFVRSRDAAEPAAPVRTAAACAIIALSVVAFSGCASSGDVAAPSPGATSTSRTPAAPAAPTAPTEQVEQVEQVDPATLAADGNGIAWTSPTKNISCRISSDTYGSGCQSRDAPVPRGAACTNPTFTVDELSKGFFLHPDRVEPTCFNQGVFASEFPVVLEYDQSVTFDGYTCTSRRTAMMCSTANGHGFELSRETANWY
ncbi:hypothetical protein CH304_06100 [Rhodococcus sp. 15-649-1-2]|nr:MULTISPECIES: DUF6636 domain-containing protein [unclassified Rhodococcus (in: high G+C Gram-positive bacteria)]OZC86191.1 hypothetical protein CH282_12130 [Rhodococcus sp. 06-418-1B]OZE84734.1 hypothetical protein CH304_06100 [Rhodococcus sp. 15-649-1-2]